jgi:two-component system sensor histidine kinase/response regulator
VTDAQNLETALEELRTAQAALERERRRYAELFDVAPDALFVTDIEGRVVEANSAALEMLGVPPQRTTGQRLAEFFPADAQEAFATALRGLARGKPIVERAFPLRRGDGEGRTVQARAVTLSTGEVRWALRDVTEQRAVEVELRAANVQLETRLTEGGVELDRQQALLAAVLEQNPLGLAIVDESEQVVLANSEARRILGGSVTPSQVEGHRLDGAPYDGDWPILRSLRAAEVVIGERARIVRPDGEHVVVEINSGPIRDTLGHTVAAVAVFRDVTLAEQRTQAEREFVSNAAHELRNPIAGISGAIEVLRAGAKDDPQAREHFLGRLSEDAERVSRLTDALLTLARIDAVGRESSEAIDVGFVIEEAAQAVAPPDGLDVRVDVVTGITAEGDGVLLRQVLIGLLTNAFKNTPAPGAVTLRARAGGKSEVMIEVNDTGSGIAPDEVNRVFERFYRGSGSLQKAGFGLGLSIAKRMVDVMGGEIGLESEIGVGSTFWVRLPAARPAPAPVA